MSGYGRWTPRASRRRSCITANCAALNGIIGEDPELYVACMDVYNEWLSEYTRPSKRVIGVALLPAFLNPAGARDQMQKLKELGYRVVMMPSYPKRCPLQQP